MEIFATIVSVALLLGVAMIVVAIFILLKRKYYYSFAWSKFGRLLRPGKKLYCSGGTHVKQHPTGEVRGHHAPVWKCTECNMTVVLKTEYDDGMINIAKGRKIFENAHQYLTKEEAVLLKLSHTDEKEPQL